MLARLGEIHPLYVSVSSSIRAGFLCLAPQTLDEVAPGSVPERGELDPVVSLAAVLVFTVAPPVLIVTERRTSDIEARGVGASQDSARHQDTMRTVRPLGARTGDEVRGSSV